MLYFRRMLLLLACTATMGALYAQFSTLGNSAKLYHNEFQGIDYLVVFDGLNASSAIVYNGTDADKVKWYTFDNPTTELILQNQAENFLLNDATGYTMVDVNGTATTFWVIDYQIYKPDLTAIELVQSNLPCEELTLNLQATIPDITYKTPTGIQKKINRKFKLEYDNIEWSGSAWKDIITTDEFTYTSNLISVLDIPLKNTVFNLSGDQFATDLGLKFTIASANYDAVKTECHIISKASVRSELNEDELPDNESITTASAPLELVLSSNANVPVTQFYQWDIYKDNSLLIVRNDQDVRYTFQESGTYKIKLTVNSAIQCTYSDSITIKVVESAMEVPRAFTPNGDGKNDEFRVAYKSLVEFRCWIFNRWQQQIYFWNDPQKGWDGTYKGTPVKPGAYFYIIEAKGADGVVHNKKGDINLLR